MGFGDFISKTLKVVSETTKKTFINGFNGVFDGISSIYNSFDAAIDIIRGKTEYIANTTISSWQDKPVSENKKTYIVIHGFQSGANEQWVKNIEEQLALRDPDANVVALDWLDNGKGKSYVTAANKTVSAGKQLAQYLEANNIDPSNVTLIGHSLGAHVAGFASQFCKSFFGKGVSEIIALDPAGVRIATILEKFGLNKECAERVEVIHTNYTLGTKENLGHLDIHVNPNELTQPRHDHFVGNHSYAQDLFVQLLKKMNFKQSDGSTLNLDFIKNQNGNYEMIVDDHKGAKHIITRASALDGLLGQPETLTDSLSNLQSSFAQEFNFTPEILVEKSPYNGSMDNFGLHVNLDGYFQSGSNDWLLGQSNTTNHSTETRLDAFQSPSVFNTNLDMFGINFLNSNNSLPLHMGSLSQVNDSDCYMHSLVDIQNSNNIISGQSQNAFMKIDGQSFV